MSAFCFSGKGHKRRMAELIWHDLETIVQQYWNKNLYIALIATFVSMMIFLMVLVLKTTGYVKSGIFARLKQTLCCFAWFFGLFLFIYYGCYLLELTLFTREAGSRTDVNLQFLGTWHQDIYSQCFMVENVLLFLPFGCLFAALCPWVRKLWKILLCSFFLSLAIECTQLWTGRGFFQIDDLWLNTLGGVAGSIPCLFLNTVKNRKLKKNALE